MAAMEIDRVAATFKDQTVFLTGATGFMGKVFLERLLRVTEVRKIFILIRTKRDKNADDRLIDIFQNPLFDKLKASRPLAQILERVQVVSGDCGFKRLNLSADDHAAITRSVSMIFHFAATVKFTEKFKRAIELNVRGTREMIQLALECEHLQVFCHLSTAFCHLDQKMLYERPYTPPADPHEMIEVAEKFGEERVEQLLGGFLTRDVPNSYVFTKALSEALVADAHVRHKLPVLMCRPVIIMSMYKDPIPGWTDNMNNVAGVFTAAGLGVLRTLVFKKDTECNTFPVDYTINNIMTSTWDYLSNHKASLHIVNLEYEPVEMYDEWQIMLKILRELYPFDITLWYPNVALRQTDMKDKIIHNIEWFFFQFIPALLVDGLLRLIGRKPVLMRANTKISRELSAVRIFMDNKWTFDQTNMKVINKLMNDVELESYGTEDRDRTNFMKNSALGVRRYVFKQSDKNLDSARRKMTIFYYVDRFFKLAFFAALFYFFWSRFTS